MMSLSLLAGWTIVAFVLSSFHSSSALLITNANGLDLDQDQFYKIINVEWNKIILVNTSEYKQIVLFCGT